MIGKSTTINKIDALDLLDTPAALRNLSDPSKAFNGRILFYVDAEESSIYLHFETAFDDHLLLELTSKLSATGHDYHQINAHVQSQFSQVFMFAASVCHLLILTEPGETFNSSYLPLFRALGRIRETKFLKYAAKTAAGAELSNVLGKELRLCAPKMIYTFERADATTDSEADMEDDIYSILKAENILHKNNCLFVLPKRLPFVHIHRNPTELNPVKDAMDHLVAVLQGYAQGTRNEQIIEPSVGYGRHFRCYSKDFVDKEIEDARVANQQKKHSLRRVIRKHVKELLGSVNSSSGNRRESESGTTVGDATGPGTGDAGGGGTTKVRHRPNVPTGAVWLEIFEAMHSLTFGQAKLENPDPEYVSIPFIVDQCFS